MMLRLCYLAAIYFWFVLIFILQKPLFMLWQGDLYATTAVVDWLRVMWHGLPIDFSVAAYLSVVPFLLTLVAIWVPGRWLLRALRVYFALMVTVLGVVCMCDAELYGYWGFRLDATPLFYLQSPADAMASVPLGTFIAGVVGVAVYVCLVGYPLDRWLLRPMVAVSCGSTWQRKATYTPVYLVAMAFLFLPIRGGVSASTMNVGKAYFSERIELNHAAVNPAFSFLASLSKGEDFRSLYRFMSPAEADEAYAPLAQQPVAFPTDTTAWLTTSRPDILLIILESFTGHIIDEPGVMPCLKKLSCEGIYFPHFYANSFRTDRGLVALLSGYPAQPTTSIMKYPAKSQSLPAIARSLRGVGYDTQMIYGGDADFTNMRSYYYATGYSDVVSVEDFTAAENSARWGVPDHIMFPYLLRSVKEQTKHPFIKTFLTLSSHEPFDVPMRRLDNLYLNSVAYTDSCLGAFVDSLRLTPQWDNTLIIFVADHTMRYPAGIKEHEVRRHHIPMIWCGGAVRGHRVVERYGAQTDLAATLLAQMQIDYSDFSFSKNMADTAQRAFAYYTYKDGLGYVDEATSVVYDCESQQWIVSEGPDTVACRAAAQAYLQKLYDDLGNR
ncbi:MAG: sulfatase-like hydrolase/transferase [Coprobacter sp.]|nr:sulfatase-like hydrolase/transferase [Coprobacter sp.]